MLTFLYSHLIVNDVLWNQYQMLKNKKQTKNKIDIFIYSWSLTPAR